MGKKGIIQIVTEEVAKDAKYVGTGVKTGVVKATEIVKPAEPADESVSADESAGIIQIVTEEVTKDAKIVEQGVKTGVVKATEIVKPAKPADESVSANESASTGESASTEV